MCCITATRLKQTVTSSLQKGPPEALGGIQFFPKSFFELKYYPYYGKLRHVSVLLIDICANNVIEI